MRTYCLRHLCDDTLLRDLARLLEKEWEDVALIVAHIAEVDSRKLYLRLGFPSMFAYCVRKWHMSEDVAYKRIRAGRAGRRFPAILDALATGRLHLAAVVLLSPHLRSHNVEDLLASATHKSKSEVEQIIAERFPRPDVASRITSLAPRAAVLASVESQETKLAPGPVSLSADERDGAGSQTPTPGSSPLIFMQAAVVNRPAVVKPLAPQRFAIQFTISSATRDKLRHVQALLSHQLPSGDIAEVFDRALDALTTQLERQKFAAVEKPRQPSPHSTANTRHIPADVKRAVWKRDQGQCTFVSDTGQRCASRRFLEFDHAIPVARGGTATVSQIRLRCRAHNQYEAECMFGAGFMNEKRDARRRASVGSPESAAGG
jgi:hypothetical protein